MTDKAWLSKIYKHTTQHQDKKKQADFKKWAKDLNRQFFKEVVQMASSHSKRDSTLLIIQFSSVQSLSRDRLFATPWITARQASLSITNSWSLLKLMWVGDAIQPSHPLSSPSPPASNPSPASGSLPMSQFFTWGGQSIGVSTSASVLPMNTQDWSPLWWTGWRELQIKITMRYYFPSVRTAITKKTTHNKCWWGCGEKGTLVHCCWKCKLVQPLWKKA